MSMNTNQNIPKSKFFFHAKISSIQTQILIPKIPDLALMRFDQDSLSSQFSILNFQFSIPNSQFPIPNSQLSIPQEYLLRSSKLFIKLRFQPNFQHSLFIARINSQSLQPALLSLFQILQTSFIFQRSIL